MQVFFLLTSFLISSSIFMIIVYKVISKKNSNKQLKPTKVIIIFGLIGALVGGIVITAVIFIFVNIFPGNYDIIYSISQSNS